MCVPWLYKGHMSCKLGDMYVRMIVPVFKYIHIYIYIHIHVCRDWCVASVRPQNSFLPSTQEEALLYLMVARLAQLVGLL